MKFRLLSCCGLTAALCLASSVFGQNTDTNPPTQSNVVSVAADTNTAAEAVETNAAPAAPPIYLDPKQPVEARVADLLGRMTFEEKLNYIGGTNGFYIGAIPRLNVPAIKMSDGPMGSRNDGMTTCYPGGIALAATWDRDLATKLGVALGRDCRARGVNILLAPAVNIYRSPLCGRNFEYMGEDPFLAGQLVAPLIQGIQSQQVLATVKHFACNNQEWDRHRISSEVDERTLQEIYLPAFKAAVQQGKVACVMTAYNLLNGVHCSQDDWLINQTLKTNWGFQGFVMSDWDSTYDAVGAANGGLDLEMPSGKFLNPAKLKPAIDDGQVSQAMIDDKVRRILRTVIAAHFFDRPQLRSDIERNDPANAEAALAGAREAIVLLKNRRHTLPLDAKKIKSIAVLGHNANPAIYCGGGSAFTRTFAPVSILDGIKALAGDSIKVLSTTSTNIDDAVALAKQADVAIVCAGFTPRIEGEGHDRPFELTGNQTNLIQAVARANVRTVVVLNSGGGVAWQSWLNRVPAVLQAWYPGQAVGQAVAEVLFGAVNPSAKLPATFEKRAEDNPSYPYYHIKTDMKTPYTEGIFVGYRGYDKKDIDPEFCFGHGLSYTAFKYGKMEVSPKMIPPLGKVTVTVTVKNDGPVAGDEVVQLYAHLKKGKIERPVQVLVGFQRVSLQPGESKPVKITVSGTQLGYWDVNTHDWAYESGTFELRAGSSSRDIRSKGKFQLLVPGT
ncbi:MAG: glycoside hydrolase family 3 C-terminal domain-containing protein [Verrucomicrobiota bacterium]